MDCETAAGQGANADGVHSILLQPGLGRKAVSANLESRVLVVDDCEPLPWRASG
jgi:hypothetical protein